MVANSSYGTKAIEFKSERWWHGFSVNRIKTVIATELPDAKLFGQIWNVAPFVHDDVDEGLGFRASSFG